MFFSFENQSYLIFLFIIPIIIFFHFYNLRNIGGKALRFANYEAIARVKGIDIYSKNLFFLIINILIVMSLVFSISGLTLHKEMKATAFSYIIAIDASQSMGARDMYPNRLTAAKESAKDFIDELPYDTKVGITSFAYNTYIEKKPETNKDVIKTSIDNIQLTEIGGTDIYEVYRTSSNLLFNDSSKAIIILSDGQINTGNIDEVVFEASIEGVVIHTIGIGTIQGGNTSFGISKLDEDSLKSLAYSTKGRYFNAINETGLKNSFKEIIPLTKKIGAIDLSNYLIILTMVLFILSQIMNNLFKDSI